MRYLITLLFVLCAYGAEEPSPLFAFVAEKISIEHLPQTEGEWDYKFKARYRNLQNVYGDLPLGIIEFTGSDSIYRSPKFSRHEHVVLYLTQMADGTYHHLERLYNVIYKTPEGKWAGPVNYRDYQNEDNIDSPIKPIDIAFPKSSWEPLIDSQVDQYHYYPEIWEPNYIIENNFLIPVKGNFIEELFELKKNAVLKDQGYFGGREKNSMGE